MAGSSVLGMLIPPSLLMIIYGVLAEQVVTAVEGDPVDLIETVAERVAAGRCCPCGIPPHRRTAMKPLARLLVALALGD